ncbi:MAG: molybdenum cofactor guanylyltransferase [Oscillospiraceae bacterium]|jgi:molybdopterin-guanine dinucleotide biosynthesis protein A|nr:molybdenum cofactor guanylyltransferase [Oscillospiraceae bacterium]
MQLIDKNSFISVAMLAGGKAKRFEFDKQLLHLQKDSLFTSVLPTLNQHFDEVLVVTSKPKLYDDLNVKTIQDIFPQKGPLSGIHAALSFSKSKYVYIIACDMPNIDIDYINYMKQRLISIGADACVTQFADRIEPFHAFYSKNALKTIEEDLLADLCSIKHLLQKINTLYISEEEARQFTPDWSLFQNINF